MSRAASGRRQRLETGESRDAGESRVIRDSRRVCGVFFVGAGVLHLVRPRTFEQIVPPGFGDRQIVVISGLAEIVGGASLARREVRRFSRWWLIALLIAVFPANVYMAVDPAATGTFGLPRWLLWLRLPLQGAGIWWVASVTREKLRVQLPS
jgi:uncharacterized membrane protein